MLWLSDCVSIVFVVVVLSVTGVTCAVLCCLFSLFAFVLFVTFIFFIVACSFPFFFVVSVECCSLLPFCSRIITVVHTGASSSFSGARKVFSCGYIWQEL